MAYDPQPFMDRAQAAADGGTATYRKFFEGLDHYHKTILTNEGYHKDYKKIAKKVDERNGK